LLQRLDKIKGEGNNCFRGGKYAEACDKYYEVLNEISYLGEKDGKQYHHELEELEILCRLNIANVKMKSEDWDFVIRECAKVLRKTDGNFKAHYRSGVGYFKKGGYDKAETHFNRAREINKNEESTQSI
jgi:tetratricopeptide (TPR) repeat protein